MNENNSIQLTKDSFAGGQIVREPVGFANGYWAGAPGAFYAADERAWYLSYRIRRPRGIEPDRGGEARIARSTDLKNWEDIWSVTKDRYRSASIEKSAIRKGADGQWRYFTSFVDPADGRWCVSVLKADEIEKLDAARAQTLFKAKPLGLEGVKDPSVLEWRGMFYMILSVAVRTPRTTEQSHATLDIFNTGECISTTGLATSRDLDHWGWQSVVFNCPPKGWDGYCRRINSAVPMGEQFLAFYDGSASHAENYEERTGLATSANLREWKSLTPSGPAFTSPFTSTSLRYIDTHLVAGEVILFYEFARPDAAHDLRMIRCEPGALRSLL
jgi:hypothetical protein